MNRLQEWIKNISEWWDKLNINQKVLFFLTGTLITVVIATAGYFAIQPDYTVLFSKLSPQDANAVVEHLKDTNVPYRITGGGTMVEIPSRSVYDVRIELAGKGLPKGEGVGFEIFDKVSFGVTDEVQQINYLRAMQNELERTIDSLVAVEKSRVHLVIPKEEIWFQESFKPKASVMVRLATGGSLLPSQINSIRHILASAVSGLHPENVTIVDTNGKVLSAAGDSEDPSGLSERQISYKEKVEKGLREKAESLLFEIVGVGKAAVQVHAEVDFDQVVKEREYYEPIVGGRGLVRSETKNSETPSNGGASAGGAAGAASNLQGYPPAGVYATRRGGSKNGQQTNYEMNRTVERVTTASGAIKKLSVGIFVDGEMKPEQLAAIQGVIAKALGIRPDRGDELEVQALPFYPKEKTEDKTLLEKSQRQKFIMTLVTDWLPRALLVIVALGFLMTSMKHMKKMTVAATQSGSAAKKGSNKGEADNVSSDELLTLLKQNPNETAQLLKNWLS